MNAFLDDPSLAALVLYYGAFALNFIFALWMATAATRMRETDYWLPRMVVTVAGLAYAIISISMLKNPEFAPHASSLVWWWLTALAGILVVVHNFKPQPINVVRLITYVGAIVSIWGTTVVFNEQAAFGELGTYYGFFAANLAAAVWLILNAMMSSDEQMKRRLISLGTGVVYVGLVITAVVSMQMILESPY